MAKHPSCLRNGLQQSNEMVAVRSRGLDYPRTGFDQVAISLSGLRNLVVKEIAFVGTAGARTDAAVTLLMTDVDKAQLKHDEFYGLITLYPGGGS